MSLPGVNNLNKRRKDIQDSTDAPASEAINTIISNPINNNQSYVPLKNVNPVEHDKKIRDIRSKNTDLSIEPADNATHDYAGYFLSGQNDNAIFDDERLHPKSKVGLMPIEYFATNPKYKELAINAGVATEQNWNEVAPGLYEDIESRYAEYDINKFNESPLSSYRKKSYGYQTDLGKVPRKYDFEKQFETGDDRFVMHDVTGEQTRVKTDDESAEDKGIYYDINGKKKNLDSWDKKNGGITGGNNNFLSIGYDLVTGVPSWQEVNGLEEQNTDKIRSYWGPQKMYSDFWSEAGWGLYNTLPRVTGGGSGMLNDLSTIFSPVPLTPGDAKAGKENINYRNNLFYGYYKHKSSLEAETDPSSAAGWGRFVGGVAGSVAEMVAFKKFSTSLIAGADKLKVGFSGARTVVDAEKMAKYGMGAEKVNKIATNTSIGIMSLNGAYSFDDMAKNMGVSKEARAYMFFPIAMTEFLSERIFGTKFEEGILKYSKSKEFLDELKPIIEKVAIDQGNKQTVAAGRKEVMQRLWAGAKRFSGKALSEKHMIGQTGRESLEELAAGRGQNLLMAIHDLGKVATNGNSFFNEGRYFYQEDENGTKYRYDKSTNSKDRISDETYEKGVQAMKKPLKKGEGLFGVYEEGMGFSDVVGNIFEGSEDDMLGGAFAAGMFMGINRIGNKNAFRANQQQDYIVSQVAEGKAQAIRAEIMEHIKQSTFGPNDIGEDGKALTVEDIKAGKKSMNQIIGEQAIADIDAAEAIFNALKPEKGYIDIQKLSEIVGPGAAKFSVIEYIDKVKERQGLETENKTLEEQLIDPNLPVADKENIQAKLNDNNIKMKDLSLQIDDIKSGDRNKERIQDNFFRMKAKENGDLLTMKTEQGEVPVTAENLKLWHQRFNQAYENAKAGVAESSAKQTDITERSDKLSKDISSIDLMSPDIELFDNELAALNADIKKFGTSRENVNKIKNAFEKRKDELKAKLIEIDPEDFDPENMDKFNADLEANEPIQNEIDAFDNKSRGYSFDSADFYDTFQDVQITNRIEEIDQQILDTEGDSAIPADDKGRIFDIQKLKQERERLGDYLHNKTRQEKLDKLKEDTGRDAEFIPGDIVLNRKTNFKGRITNAGAPGFYNVEYGDGKSLMVNANDLEYVGVAKPKFIEGQIKSELRDSEFKAEVFDTYLDKQGNSISISNTINDLEKRVLNAEDEILLKRLSDALHNNKALYLASQLQQDLINEKKYDVGKYGPNNNTILSEENKQVIGNHLAYNEYRIKTLKDKQQLDTKDKSERQIKLRVHNLKMRTDIASMFMGTYDNNSAVFADLIQKNNDLISKLETDKNDNKDKKYSPELIIEINKNLIELESMMHVGLNSIEGSKILDLMAMKFTAYKGFKEGQKFSDYAMAVEFTIGKYDDIYSYEAFSEKHEEGRFYQLSRNVFAKLIFVNHLQNIKRLEPKKFYEVYNMLIENITKINGNIPSFEQEQMLYHATSFLRNSDQNLINKLESSLTSRSLDFSNNQLFSNMLFLRGFAGAGKTTMIKHAISLSNALNGTNGNILTSAPSPGLRNSLTASINSERNNNTQQGLDYNGLISLIASNSVSNIDSIIVDESSNWSEEQVKTLHDLLNDKGMSTKVLFLGDQSQMTSISETEGNSRSLPVERVMERTMPITEIYRSGVSDISNLQTAFRDAIFIQKDPILPNGTYDADKNNGLLYFNGSKMELIDRFISDINSIDDFKKQNTVLIVYSNKEREHFLNYIKSKITDQTLRIDQMIKTMEEGENSAQGYEYGRVYVAITTAEAKGLYNRAMLTAISRAVKTNEHNGFVTIISDAYSEQGDPIVIKTATNTPEEIAIARTYYAGIIGKTASEYIPTQQTAQTFNNGNQKVNPDAPTNQTNNNAPNTSSSTVTQEQFDKVNAQIRALDAVQKINFNESGLGFVDGKPYRYTINGIPVRSVTEVKTGAIKLTKGNLFGEEGPHTVRGVIIHKVAERVVRQRVYGGKLFSEQDEIELIDLINNYNSLSIKYNAKSNIKGVSMLSEIPVLNPGDLEQGKNKFINNVIQFVGEKFADKLASKGKFSIPEAIIGLIDSKIAGRIDNIDVVSIEGDNIVVDLYDIKTITTTGDRNFNSSQYKQGRISTLSTTITYSPKNEALAQLSAYASILEQGDDKLGLPKIKVRNIIIAKVVATNGHQLTLNDDMFLTYDYNSKEFEEIKNIGKDIAGIKSQAKTVKVKRNTPDIDKIFINNNDKKSRITGAFLIDNIPYIQLDNFEEIPENQFRLEYNEYKVPFDQNIGEEGLFNRSALQFTQGYTNSTTFISAVPSNKETSIHQKIKQNLFGSIKSNLSLQQRRLQLVFHNEYELTNESGELETFKNVLLTHYPEANWGDLVSVMKKMPEFVGKTDAELLKEIEDNQYDIMSSLFHADSGFSPAERGISKTIDFENEGQVQALLEKIDKGFLRKGKPDQYATQLREYHKHLVQLRRIGSLNSDASGLVGLVPIMGFKPESGSAGRVNYTGEFKTHAVFVRQNTGVTFGSAYFDSNAIEVTKNGQKLSIPSIVIDAWHYGQHIDGVKVLFRSRAVQVGDFDAKINEIKSLKKSTFTDIMQSAPYRFLQWNRNVIKSKDGKSITDKIEGLNQLLKFDGVNIEFIRKNYKEDNVKDILNILEQAYVVLKSEFNKGNQTVKSMYYMPPFKIGDDKSIRFEEKELNNLLTTAGRINQPPMYLRTSVIPIDPDTDKNKIVTDFNFESEDSFMSSEPDQKNIVANEVIDENDLISNDPSYVGLIPRFFGNKAHLDMIRKTIALDVKRKYWSTDIKSQPQSLNDVLNDMYEAYQMKTSIIMNQGYNIIEGIENIESFEDVNGDNIQLLSPIQKRHFAEYTLGKNRDVFNLFIKKIINVDASDLKKRVHKDKNELSNKEVGEERDGEINSTESQSRSMDEQEYRNPFDSVSGVLKIALENIRLNEYDKNGVAHPTNRFADYSIVRNSLMFASQAAFNPIYDPTQNDFIDRISENILRLAESAGQGSVAYNSLLSFHEEFFKDNAMDALNNPNTSNKVSHLSLIKNISALKIQYPHLISVIDYKSLNSSRLLSGLFTGFASLVTKNNLYVEKVGNNLYLKSSINKGYADISKNINTSMEAALFENNDEQVNFKDYFKDRVIGDNIIYSINLSGIIDERSNKLLIKTNVRNNIVSNFEIPENVTVEEVRELLALIGITGIYSATIKSMMEKRTDDTNISSEKTDRNSLANALGNLLFAAKAGISPNSNVTDTVEGVYKKNGYMKKPFSFLDEEQMKSIQESSESIKTPGEDMVKPSDLFREVELLAHAQSAFSASISSDFYYNSLGKRSFKHQLGSTIFRIFSQDKVFNNLRSSKLKEQFEKVLKNMTLEEAQLYQGPHAIIDNDRIFYLNPLLDPNSGWDVHEVYSADGINNTGNSVKVSKNMTDADYAKFLINGIFVNDVLHENAMQSFKYVFHNPADKSNPPVLAISMSRNRDEKIFNKTSNGIEYDKKWRFENVIGIFKYYEHQKNISINKWINFLQNISDKYNYDVVGNYKEKIKTEMAKINDLVKQILSDDNGITPELFLQELQQDISMEDTLDYIVLEEVNNNVKSIEVKIGNAISMRFSNVYTKNKLRELKRLIDISKENLGVVHKQEIEDAMALDPNDWSLAAEISLQQDPNALLNDDINTFIDKIFYKEMNNFTNYLKSVGFRFDEKYTYPKELSTRTDKWNKFNPTIESFFYAWHFSDTYVSQLVMGSPAGYTDIADYFKRSSGPVAPNNLLDTTNPNGISQYSNYVILNDERIPSLFNGETLINTDGLGIKSALTRNLETNSSGGPGVSVIGDSMNKFVYYKHDVVIGSTKYHKYAELILTDELINESVWAEEQFKKLVGDELYNKWNELGRSQNELTKYVIQNKLNDTFIHYAIYASAVKRGKSGIVNSNIPDYTPFIQKADNSYRGVQLNPSQDLSNTKLSAPSQLVGMLMHGQANFDNAQRFIYLKAKLGEIGWEKIKSKFYEYMDVDENLNPITPRMYVNVDKFKKYVRALIKKGSDNSNDVSKLSELISDKDASLDLPTIRKAVLQYLANEITNQALKVKWNGYRMNQAPGFMFDIYEVNGSVYTRKSASKYGIDKIEGIVPRGLKPTRFYYDADRTQEILTKEDYLAHTGEVFVKLAEIVMPYAYFEQFGLKEKIDSDPNFTLQDIFIITKADGSIVDLRTIPNEMLMNTLTSLFEEEGNSGYVLDRFKTDSKSIKGKNTVGAVMLEKGQSKLLNQAGIVKAEGWLTNFKESLKIVNDRIPTSSSSSAGIGEIIGWIKDSGNTVFTSAEKNILDGSDYDIDQLNIYFKFLDENGIIISGEDSIEGIINELFDLVGSYYNNSANFKMFMQGVSTKRAENLVKDKIENQNIYKKSVNMPSSNIYYNGKIIEGKNSVGMAANGSKTFVLLGHASAIDATITGFNIDTEGLNDNGQYSIKEYELVVNAATDNAKIMALGILDITQEGVAVINGMFAKGKTFEDAVELFEKEHIQRIFARVKRSQSVDSKFKISVLESIDQTIDNWVSLDKIKKRRDEKIDEIKDLESEMKTAIVNEIDDDYDYEKRFAQLNQKLQSIEKQIAVIEANPKMGLNEIAILFSGEENTKDFLDILLLKDYAIVGEALNRANTIIKMDSQGIPVFDYDLDKLIRDIEFALNMTLDDFNDGKQPSAHNWFESRKKYQKDSDKNILFGKTKTERFRENEMAIRNAVDVYKFAKTNPFLMQNLKILGELKNFMKSSFLRDSKINNDLVEAYLDKTKQDWFPNESAYYSFYKEMQKYNTAIYFKLQYGHRLFPAYLGPSKGKNILDISTPTGRYDFSMGFGKYINDLIIRLELPDSYLSDDEILLKNNPFIKRLQATPTRTGHFVEFRDAAKLVKDDYSDLSFGFKKLPDDLKEQFYIYQLAKDNFDTTKAGLYEAIDNEMFRSYSSFLDVLSKVSIAYENGNTDAAVFNFVNADGKDLTINYFDTLNDIFLQDAAFFSEDKILLPWWSPDWKEDAVPDFYKEKKRDSQTSEYFRIKMIMNGEYYEAKTKNTFNGYDLEESVLTRNQVIKSISGEKLDQLYRGHEISITYSKRHGYENGEAYIPNGRIVKVSTFAGGITLKLKNDNSTFDALKEKTDKTSVLKDIKKLSRNFIYKELADEYLKNKNLRPFLLQGNVSFTDADIAPEFSETHVKGFFRKGNIFLNRDGIATRGEYEHSFLHELTHNLTDWALRLTDEQLSNIDGEFRISVIQFKEDMSKLYDLAKKRATDQGKLKNNRQQAFKYVFKNTGSRETEIKEFISEAMSNTKFQTWLNNEDGDEEITEDRMSLAQTLIDAIRKLFGFRKDSAIHSMLEQVMGVYGKFIENEGIKSGTEYFSNTDSQMSERMSNLVNMYKGVKNLPTNFNGWSESTMEMYDKMVRNGRIIC